MMEENRNFDGKAKGFLKNQGFYIVLFVCLLVVGTAIVLTTLPQEAADTPVGEEATGAPVVMETRQSIDETLRGKNTPLPTMTPAPTASASPSPAPTEAPRKSGAASVKKGAAPVSGEIIWGYADEHLIYSRTLDQWTTHPAVDIGCEIGTEVKATLPGTVERVYDDDALGKVVTLTHTNGRVSLYGNLDPDSVTVAAGQKLNAGDPVGKVGNSAVAECADLPHLHFGFLSDGKPVDPMDYVTLPH